MKKTEKQSPVIQLLSLVLAKVNTVQGHSWERLNHAMYEALTLCIGSGFPFAAADWEYIRNNFNPGRWIGETGWESMYALAIVVNNTEAARSCEEWLNREPMIADNVEVAGRYSKYMHLVGVRQKERLHVGATFPWKGTKATVTSFAKDGQSLIACTYYNAETDSYNQEIKKRYRITREDILNDRAERKERAALQKELYALVEAGVTSSPAILKELGIKTKEEFATLPIKKIKGVLKRLKGG